MQFYYLSKKRNTIKNYYISLLAKANKSKNILLYDFLDVEDLINDELHISILFLTKSLLSHTCTCKLQINYGCILVSD